MDPRVTRSRTRIIDVTLELLAERGVEGTTVEAIAERSGIAKTTIYRHWPTRGDVILDAFAASTTPPATPDTGALRPDLQALIGGLCEALSSTPWAALLPSLIDAAQRDPELAAMHASFAASRTAAVREVVDRGIARRELPTDADIELLIDLVSGPVFYRRLVSGAPLDRAYANTLVDRVLRAWNS